MRKFGGHLSSRRFSSVKDSRLPSRDDWWGRPAGSKAPVFSGKTSLRALKEERMSELETFQEYIQRDLFRSQLLQQDQQLERVPQTSLKAIKVTDEQLEQLLTAAFATFHLHVESRLTAAVGQGFYTIGPCGEEMLAPIGLLLEQTDHTALHYRHLAVQIARQLQGGKSLDQILLDRARAHVVSIEDPVTGGVHCSLGGGEFDYLVTSTLSSHVPPAVGRSLGSMLAKQIGASSVLSPSSIGFVSVGDGSVNHSHFLSAVNLAEYARYNNFKCPLVFAVSDNGYSISLKGKNWLQREFIQKLRMPLLIADGNDFVDVWDKTQRAVEETRRSKKPVFIVYKNLVRRFGHAATDRQSAYMTELEISRAANANPMRQACRLLHESSGISYSKMTEMYNTIQEKTETAFEEAVMEPKLTDIVSLYNRNSKPLVSVGEIRRKQVPSNRSGVHTMRKHMTSVLDEIMGSDKRFVYIGEDVVHGGYYLVSEGLAEKYQHRVMDFPPDETTLLGAAIGFAQTGLVPFVEIPYAKYLDCGFDMFNEAIIMNWLSNGKKSNGMIIRLQGFGEGIFGGNFHTHNCLYLPPGLDVVCYSNGPDYARGMRYAAEQASSGRVVMFVDCTKLLNLYNVQKEPFVIPWRRPFTSSDEIVPWNEVFTYGNEDSKHAIVSYGNGLVASLQAQQYLESNHGIVTLVIDSPYLSFASPDLKALVKRYDSILFVDECKIGQNPFAGIILELQNEGLLPRKWDCVAAKSTYNPLGCTLTFVSMQDIVSACLRLNE